MTPSQAAPELESSREILLVAHPGRPDIAETARRVGKVFDEAGICLRVLVDEVEPSKIEASDKQEHDHVFVADMRLNVVEFGPDAAVGCEMVLVLGGDGTFLRAAELAQAASIPVLGINLGHVGFLAEAEADHLEDALARVIAGNYRIEQRMTLDIAIRVGDQVVDRGWALNEASIENGSRLGVLEVVLEVDGRPVSAFGCDGVLVSTPTGSTAYAFSAGGPVVWPELEAILVIPSNAHALFARPLVTSPESIVAVEIDAGGHAGFVFCDGRRTLSLPAGARVEVVRGASPIKWVRLDSAPFADRMVKKFELPVTGWRGRAR
ncbi:NAD(+) kinase [Rhodococcus sp. 14-2483-1-1]|uniref:NAD kinase n=1 Tax=Nocardiaceae TaxID=85025 RepID=UPI00068F7EF1|nr:MULTISPECIES: NAD kinase [Rhodococcus]OZC44376.1 NAD(+) kinase [Rhodococcus sp. WWJCD1]OZC81723.1 NAD(+) kinase [Rhodococcus sp. 06-412-2C]OZC96050.1 NAD(+) kinase [Rhodococcus sp. 06-412-2B]OZE74170.1 NAD(+) kinase [Rhodococcus sp. 15-649-2-2]OZF30796.1 NAD(+) kinase [Rhodococcus sp. 14-2483-1-1]